MESSRPPAAPSRIDVPLRYCGQTTREERSNEANAIVAVPYDNRPRCKRTRAGFKECCSDECTSIAVISGDTCGGPKDARRHRPEGHLLCRCEARPRRSALPSEQSHTHILGRCGPPTGG